MSQDVSILFVCLGNICRSPTAHGVFRAFLHERGLAKRVRVDSAGTGNWHVGEPPDFRSFEAAAMRGYDIGDLCARQVKPRDFLKFDYILAMDQDNLDNLRRMCPENARTKPELFLRYAQGAALLEVPDPYYGGESGFEDVLDLVESGAAGLLAHLQGQHPEWSQ